MKVSIIYIHLVIRGHRIQAYKNVLSLTLADDTKFGYDKDNRRFNITVKPKITGPSRYRCTFLSPHIKEIEDLTIYAFPHVSVKAVNDLRCVTLEIIGKNITSIKVYTSNGRELPRYNGSCSRGPDFDTYLYQYSLSAFYRPATLNVTILYNGGRLERLLYLNAYHTAHVFAISVFSITFIALSAVYCCGNRFSRCTLPNRIPYFKLM